MSLPPDYLLPLLGLAALVLYALTWRNRLIRDPVTGRTRAWWLTADAKALIEQLRLNGGHMPATPWHAGGADRPARRHRGCRPL